MSFSNRQARDVAQTKYFHHVRLGNANFKSLRQAAILSIKRYG